MVVQARLFIVDVVNNYLCVFQVAPKGFLNGLNVGPGQGVASVLTTSF